MAEKTKSGKIGRQRAESRKQRAGSGEQGVKSKVPEPKPGNSARRVGTGSNWKTSGTTCGPLPKPPSGLPQPRPLDEPRNHLEPRTRTWNHLSGTSQTSSKTTGRSYGAFAEETRGGHWRYTRSVRRRMDGSSRIATDGAGVFSSAPGFRRRVSPCICQSASCVWPEQIRSKWPLYSRSSMVFQS